MSRRTGLFILVFVLSAIAGGNHARAQEVGILTFVEPADDILNPQEETGTARVALRYELPNSLLERSVDVDFQFYANDQPVTHTAEIADDPEAPGQIQVLAALTLNPCDLPDSNDLPGAAIGLRYAVQVYGPATHPDGTVEHEVIGGEEGVRVFTLGPDTRAPVMLFRPWAGTTVRPGETVTIDVSTGDTNASGAWATGVQSIRVLGPDGVLIGEDLDPASGPQPCDRKRTRADAIFTYTVPADAQPGETLPLSATVIDWAGNENVDLSYLTVAGDNEENEEWEGSFTLRTEALDSSTGSVMWGEVHTGQFTFTVDRSINPSGDFGTGQGNGHATRTTFGGRDEECTYQYSRPPENIDLTVYAGLLDGSFNLILGDPAGSTVTTTATCQHTGTTTSSTQWEGDEAIVPYLITLPAEDGATFTIDEWSDVWHYQGEMTIRRRTAAPGTSSASEAAGMER